MATATRITRKDIKKPDEFITLSGKIIDWFIDNKKPLLMGLGALILVVIIIACLQAYLEMREEKAATLLAEVQFLYAADRAGMNMPQLPSKLVTTPEKEEKALELLTEISDSYGGTDAARMAGLMQGQIYFEKGEYDAGRKVYEALLKKHGGDEEVSALAREGLAYCAEAQGDYHKALEAYEKINRSSLGYLRGWALLGTARCREKLGEPGKALDDYRRFIVEYSEHPRLEEVKAHIARLEQEGPGKPGQEQAPLKPGDVAGEPTD